MYVYIYIRLYKSIHGGFRSHGGIPSYHTLVIDDHHLVLKPMVTWGFKKDGVKEGVDEEWDGDIFWDLMRLQ